MTITIQTTREEGIVRQRTATTPAGARRSVIAALDDIARWYGFDDDDLSMARNVAAKWDGRTDLKVHVGGWARNGNGSTVWAQP